MSPAVSSMPTAGGLKKTKGEEEVDCRLPSLPVDPVASARPDPAGWTPGLPPGWPEIQQVINMLRTLNQAPSSSRALDLAAL